MRVTWLAMAMCGVLLPLKATAAEPKPAEPRPVKARVVTKLLAKAAKDCKHLHPQRCPELKDLIALGAGAGPHLTGAAGTSSGKEQAAALSAGAELAVEGIGPIALKLVASADRDVRQAALLAVGQLKPEGAVKALAKALGAADVNDTMLAAGALGRTRAPGAVEPLLHALSHYHPRVRGIAAHGLGLIGDKRAVDPLLNLLADPAARRLAKKSAADALGMLADKKAVPLLIFLLPLEQDEGVRKAMIIALGKLGDPGAAGLISVQLRDKAVALEAIGALGELKHRDGLPALLSLIRERRGGDEALERALYAVAAIGDKAATPVLLKLLGEPDAKVAGLAASTIGVLKDVSANEALVKALRRDEKDLREIVASALREINGVQLGEDADKWEEWLRPVE